MLWKWLVFQVFIKLCSASQLQFEIVPSDDGKQLTVINETQLSDRQIDFQTVEAILVNDTSEKQAEAQAQNVCPTLFNDLVLQYLANTLSNVPTFRDVELAPFLQVRFSGGPGNTVVRQYIEAQFQALGWTVETDASVQVTPLGFLPFTNVIATLNPNNPKRLVLACHFDSKFSPSGFIGAIDSAVPCALLIDLAKRLNDLFGFISAPVAIQMIFFDGEEPYVDFSATDSLYGSKHLAAVWQNTLDPLDNTKNKLQNIDYFILLNTIGHSATQFERYFVDTDDVYNTMFTLEVCLAIKGLFLRQIPLTRQLFQNTRRAIDVTDDHVPFQIRGVKVMHLISFPFPPQWHTLQDNAAILDYTIIEDFNRILRLFVANYYVTEAFGGL